MYWKSLAGGLTVATSLASAAPIRQMYEAPFESHDDRAHFPDPFHKPTMKDAAKHARTLVKRESIANVATLDDGYPVSFMEYYADCNNNGTITFLSTNSSASFRNVAAGSPASLSIRMGDHPLFEHVNPNYPGSIPHLSAGSPRVSLRGKFVEVESDEKTNARLAKCFIDRHRDARHWFPSENSKHDSKWVQFEVDNVYFIGGFEKFSFVGDVDLEQYKKAKPAHEGGRGRHHPPPPPGFFDRPPPPHGPFDRPPPHHDQFDRPPPPPGFFDRPPPPPGFFNGPPPPPPPGFFNGPPPPPGFFDRPPPPPGFFDRPPPPPGFFDRPPPPPGRFGRRPPFNGPDHDDHKDRRPHHDDPEDRRPHRDGPKDRRPHHEGPYDRRPHHEGDRRPHHEGPYDRRPHHEDPYDRPSHDEYRKEHHREKHHPNDMMVKGDYHRKGKGCHGKKPYGHHEDHHSAQMPSLPFSISNFWQSLINFIRPQRGPMFDIQLIDDSAHDFYEAHHPEQEQPLIEKQPLIESDSQFVILETPEPETVEESESSGADLFVIYDLPRVEN